MFARFSNRRWPRSWTTPRFTAHWPIAGAFVSQPAASEEEPESPTTLTVAINDSGDPVVGNANFTYSVICTNTGANPAENVVIDVQLDSALTFVSGVGTGWTVTNLGGGHIRATRASGAVGAMATITITVTPTNTNDTLTTTADADADNAPAASQDAETTTVVGQTTLTVAIGDSGDPVVGNANFTYSVICTNTGSNAATNPVVDVQLDGALTFVSGVGTGWTVNDLGSGHIRATRATGAVGAMPTIMITVTPTNADDTVTSTADADADNALAAAQDSENTTVVGQTTLTVAINDSADPTPGSAGYSYSVVCTNTGSNPATNVVVDVQLDADAAFVSGSGTGWTVTNLGGGHIRATRATGAVGAMPTITINVTAGATPDTYVTTADADADNAPAAAQDSENTVIVGQTTLTVSIADNIDPVITLGAYHYDVICTNTGSNAAANVVVDVQLDADTPFVSGSGTGWTVTNLGGGHIRATRATGAVGAMPTITINVTAGGAADTFNATADAVADNAPAASQDTEATVCNLVDSDATSGEYYPNSATQWTNFRAFHGITTPSNPTSGYACQNASGNLTDFMTGGVTLTLTGTGAFQQNLTGRTRKGVSCSTDGSTDRFAAAAGVGPNPTTTSQLWLGVAQFPATPAATRSLFGINLTSASNSLRFQHLITSGLPRLQSVGTTADGANAISSEFHAISVNFDRANSESWITTNDEKITPGAFNAGVNDGAKGFGNGTLARLGYLLRWDGAAAEAITSTNLKTLITALRWPAQAWS